MEASNNIEINTALGINNKEVKQDKVSSAPKILSTIAKTNLIISFILFIPVWIASYGIFSEMFKGDFWTGLPFILSFISMILYTLANIGTWAFLKTISHIGATISERSDK